jgi:hypothetical protein
MVGALVTCPCLALDLDGNLKGRQGNIRQNYIRASLDAVCGIKFWACECLFSCAEVAAGGWTMLEFKC